MILPPKLQIQPATELPSDLKEWLPATASRYLKPGEGFLLVAKWSGECAGFLLASASIGTRSSEIEALAVLPAFRRRGIASQMVRIFEDRARDLESIVGIVLYEDRHPDLADIQSILKSRGWKKPQLQIQRYHFQVHEFHPPWFEREYPLSSDFEIFPWKNLTDQERSRIDYQLRGGTFDADVHPFSETTYTTEYLNSLGMRHKGELIGWMVTHRLQPDTIRYSCFYIRDDYRHRGFSLRLLIDAIRLQQKSDVPNSTFELRFARLESRWRRFVEHRLAPYAQAKSGVMMCWKDLTQKAH